MLYSTRQLQQKILPIPSGLTFVPTRLRTGFIPWIYLQTLTMREISAMKGLVRGSWRTRPSRSGSQGRVNIYGCMGSRDAERRFLVQLY